LFNNLKKSFLLKFVKRTNFARAFVAKRTSERSHMPNAK
jgi:hypothetical protein